MFQAHIYLPFPRPQCNDGIGTNVNKLSLSCVREAFHHSAAFCPDVFKCNTFSLYPTYKVSNSKWKGKSFTIKLYCDSMNINSKD